MFRIYITQPGTLHHTLNSPVESIQEKQRYVPHTFTIFSVPLTFYLCRRIWKKKEEKWKYQVLNGWNTIMSVCLLCDARPNIYRCSISFSFLFFPPFYLPKLKTTVWCCLLIFHLFSCPSFAPYVYVDEMWKVWDQVTLDFLTAFS